MGSVFAVVVCVACGWGLVAPVGAAEAKPQVLRMTVALDWRSARVVVPVDCTAVTIQRQQGTAWVEVLTAEASPGSLRVALPSLGQRPRLRAIVAAGMGKLAQKKFPSGFYRGRSQFGPSYSVGVGAPGDLAVDYVMQSKVGVMAGDGPAGEQPAAPVEADIWQVDGTTVFYFNQMRGLQVIDAADPGKPRRVASLRLPAVGSDLYVLPGAGESRSVLLLTRGMGKTLLNLVTVSGGRAEIVHSREVKGDLMESRMAGERLFLVTSEASNGVDSASFAVTTTLSEWVIAAGEEPVAVGEVVCNGTSPVVAAGAGWLALALTPLNEWNVSEVHVFELAAGGLKRLTAEPVRTAGRLADKFKVHWCDGVLTTISERSVTGGTWLPTTVLETWRAEGPATVPSRLGLLELAEGERLFATRFAGDKAYVVTFLRTDPLWVVDLADPAAPVVAGHLEVPGWSTHLEPVGDLLFSIGWEGGTVTASLFDVATPAKPQLLRRLALGAPGSFSEAAWDEKALKVLPDQGLVLVPVSSYDPVAGGFVSGVQLLDLDVAGRDLRLRGNIPHAFEARRSTVLGDSVVSVSQRALVTADVSDREHPALLAELPLAWPADRVFASADHLVQIENGGSWSGGSATARITPVDALDAVLNEVALGEGEVVAAALQQGRLVTIRRISDGGTDTGLAMARFAWWQPAVNQLLKLDVYDASALPALPLLGSCEVDAGSVPQLKTSEILWPQENRPCLVIESPPVFLWWRGGPVIRPVPLFVSPAALAVEASIPQSSRSTGSEPRLVAFDISDPAKPSAAAPMGLSINQSTLPTGRAAGAGLVVLGADSWVEEKAKPATFERLRGSVGHQPVKRGQKPVPQPVAIGRMLGLSHSVRLIDVPVSGPPVSRPAIDLPGSLFAVTELDRNGFLAFTQTPGTQGASTLQVSACDGRDAFLIDTIEDMDPAAVTAAGRYVFAAKGDEILRFRLDDAASLLPEKPLSIGWQATDLRWFGGCLLGTSGQRLFTLDAAVVKDWQFPMWGLKLENVALDPSGALLVPFGAYGIETLAR